ncbi:hypothetical protein ABZ352_35665 [Streptomyces griseofuscus]|uniref:hypothetical protein n=1 Tax=Streptomyces griseofuscus TaxID=146922 RepID=UPI0033F5BBD1
MTVSPWAFVALILLGLVIIVAGAVVCLRLVTHDTTEAARPDIIRALADFFRSLWGRK